MIIHCGLEKHPVVASDFVNLRLLLMVAIPNLAGLILAFGLALCRARSTPCGSFGADVGS
jgi:hypothetical protein